MVKNRIFTVRHVARTTSTQDVVRRAARAGAAEGYCCLADEQTAGRGRQDRTWVAAPRSALLASVLVQISLDATAGLPFAAGLAVVDTLARCCAVAVRLKWPNDVICRGRKLAGLLVELEPLADDAIAAAVVGLGLNLTVATFPAGAAGISLTQLTDDVPAARPLLDVWLRALDARLQRLEHDGTEPLLDEWRLHAEGLGSRVSAVDMNGATFDGIARDVAPDGALLIDSGGSLRRLLAGDVHLVRHDVGAKT
jgi:BirA family biotin operon repressor/biotin-[acetyl-CoA-carboxylase] ligase